MSSGKFLRTDPSRAQAAMLAVGAVANFYWRGPFGLLPFLIFTLAPVAVAVSVLNRLHLARHVLPVAAGLLSLGSSWLIAAPPLTRTLFSRHLGVARPAGIVQRWDQNWARDRAYLLQFSASPQTIDEIVERSGMRPMSRTPLFSNPFFLSEAPAWWQSGGTSTAGAWEKEAGLLIQLRYDASDGLAQLGFFER
ncbi:MAG: hypothetical protein KBH81_03130 [Phycisphaerae bacterium]|jgi:hypothetical protein|nr:hypothetical protein [Phycisphaerae bacterium]HOO17146.1 hypothetical protein [Phycisphaerae bacterium]HPC23748.1 hypothetical protein [Phycisphaerae bacterium]HRS29133.1 hypothetical protein [Phycisphaerae bacterium]HRT42810.1 hypothetical protein [Phycisphaerae bacterium]